MPTIDLTWAPNVFRPQNYRRTQYPNVTRIRWRAETTNAYLPKDAPGVYIIMENNRPVYGGQASNIRDRFHKRSHDLLAFRIRANLTLPNKRVYIAAVTPMSKANLDYAEQWLIRYLFIYDRANPPQVLQNELLTAAFVAPNDGLTIQNQHMPVLLNTIVGANNFTYLPNGQVG